MFARPEVRALPFDGGMVVFDQHNGRLFAYNDSAALIWSEFALGRDASETLAAAYRIPKDRAENDVRAALEHWKSLNLIAGPVSPVNSVPPASESSYTTPHGPLDATYRMGGRLFHIAISDGEVAERTAILFSAFRVPDTAGAQRFDVTDEPSGELVLKRDGVEILRSGDPVEMSGGLFHALLSSFHGQPPWLAAIHGSAVSMAGRGVMITGVSGSGKSTLTAYLVARGHGYLSDDLIAVMEDGRIAPWPVPMSIKEGSWAPLAPHLPQLAALPAIRIWGRHMKYIRAAEETWHAAPAPAAALIFPRYRKGAEHRLDAVTPLDALSRLLSDRVWLGYPLQGEAVEHFLDWLSRTPAYELTYSEFEEAERLVREAAGRE